MRSHQNESLAIAGRNLFDDEASSSKLPMPPQTLHKHSPPNSSGFQNPIIFPIKQMGRVIDSRDIWLIQSTCTFQRLRIEDPLRHVKHYLSIVDNIEAEGATRDTSRLRFFHFSLKGKAVEWLDRITPTQITTKLDQFTQFCFSSFTEEEGWNRIEEYVQYQDDQWDEPSPSINVSSISEAMQPTLRGRTHEADECEQNNPSEQESAPKGRRPRKLHTAMSHRTPSSKERPADLGASIYLMLHSLF
ncbi:hypothetical protein Tco_0281844 [Tanacetum coccineum]